MSSVPLTIVLDVTKTETGLWCHRCLLPSGWRVPLLAMSLAGVSQVGVIACCGNCDEPLEAQ